MAKSLWSATGEYLTRPFGCIVPGITASTEEAPQTLSASFFGKSSSNQSCFAYGNANTISDQIDADRPAYWQKSFYPIYSQEIFPSTQPKYSERLAPPCVPDWVLR